MTPAEHQLLRALVDAALATDAYLARRDALEAARDALDAEAGRDSGQTPKPASDAPTGTGGPAALVKAAVPPHAMWFVAGNSVE